MRALRTVIIVAVLFVVCSAAKATFRKDQKELSKSFAVNTYIKAVKNGKAANLNKVLAGDPKFTAFEDAKVESVSKRQAFADIKQRKDLGKTLRENTHIVENGNSQNVVKVAMRSPGFERDDYLTLKHTGDGWKIAGVYMVSR